MRLPPAVQVSFSPSRLACALIGSTALLTCGAVAVLPLDPALLALCVLAVVAWAADRIYVVALRRGPRAVLAMWLSGDKLVVVRDGTGRLTAGYVRSATYVGARITTIVWCPDGARFSRAELVLPDMLPANDFRRLRVQLRYGRSEDADGAPASQA